MTNTTFPILLLTTLSSVALACAEPEPTAAPSTRSGPEGALPSRAFVDSGSTCGVDDRVGTAAEDFALPTPDGGSLRLSSYRGRVVLLNFWGTWCGPCLEELPEFSALYQRYRGAGLSLLAVATDEDPDAVRRVVDELELAAKVAVGGEDVAASYGRPRFPFTYVIGPDGTIRAAYDGFDDDCLGDVESAIRSALAEI